MDEQEKAIPTSVTLFPAQRQIVTEFAVADRRSFSSAVQIIIEDWARMKAANAQRPPVIEQYMVVTDPTR